MNRPIDVLICDDYGVMRTVLRQVVELMPNGRVVGEAADGAEAVSEAKRLQPDLILLDLAMPVMTGIEALPELRRVAPAAKIVVLSGFAKGVVADEVLALGADAYMEKGSDLKSLIQVFLHVVSLDGQVVSP